MPQGSPRCGRPSPRWHHHDRAWLLQGRREQLDDAIAQDRDVEIPDRPASNHRFVFLSCLEGPRTSVWLNFCVVKSCVVDVLRRDVLCREVPCREVPSYPPVPGFRSPTASTGCGPTTGK